MTDDKSRIETKIIHAGEASPRIMNSLIMPIFQTSTFEYEGDAAYHDIKYTRLNNNPNHLSIHRKLAALENADAALVAGSGMAAISTALLALLSTGDHLLVQEGIYGGTHGFLTHDLPRLGITFDWINPRDPSSWKEKLKPTTKIIYVETMSNPLLEVPDLEAVVNFAKEHELSSLIDNTFASPINFRPSEWGFDLSLHSCTKYLNGHSDLIAGAVIGKEKLVKIVTQKLNHLGGCLDPHATFLLQRGMKTLALRVGYQNESALKLAKFLASHPQVSKVHYPGLEKSSEHSRAKKFLTGFGGVLSFQVKAGVKAAQSLISNLKIPAHAPSLGGIETLVTRPAVSTHGAVPAEERARSGIKDELVRVSVGLENTDDLIEDFQSAFEKI